MRCVYKRPQGGNLLNEHRHPEAIKAYLREEAAQIAQRASDYEILVELGCSAGRYAGLARRLGLHYVGVDKEAKYLRRARRRYPEVHLIKSAGEASLLSRLHQQYGKAKVLLVLPFNLLGILPDAAAFLHSFLQTASDWGIFISIFQAGQEASVIRRRYYAFAGLQNLCRTETEAGVVFRAAGGFTSTAFHSQRVAQLLAPLNPGVESYALGRIATFYYKPASLLT